MDEIEKKVVDVTWLKIWQDNYKGNTPEAKELEKFMKTNYGGHNYIPWATMQRLMFSQDPNAELEVVPYKDESYCENNSSGILHTQKHTVITDDGTNKTEVTMFVHYVVIRCKFLGFEVLEYYPVQTPVQKMQYSAPKVVDQNMVNKALQRGKVKAISMATGLALRLYEDGDLQFDNEEAEESKPIKNTPSEQKRVSKIDVPPMKEKVKVGYNMGETFKSDDGVAKRLADYIHGNEEVLEPLKKINASLVKKYGFALSPDDTMEELIEKISQFPEPATTHNVILKMVADKKG